MAYSPFGRGGAPGTIVPVRLTFESLFSSATGWTILGDETANLTTDVNHILGTKSLEFDKVDATGTTKIAGVYCTVDWNLNGIGPQDKIIGAVQASALTNIAYAFIRLGTSASHYTEWRLADTSMTAAVWSNFNVSVQDASAQTGNGVLWDNIDYLVVGVMFDGEANALADMYWNYVGFEQAILTRT